MLKSIKNQFSVSLSKSMKAIAVVCVLGYFVTACEQEGVKPKKVDKGQGLADPEDGGNGPTTPR